MKSVNNILFDCFWQDIYADNREILSIQISSYIYCSVSSLQMNVLGLNPFKRVEQVN